MMNKTKNNMNPWDLFMNLFLAMAFGFLTTVILIALFLYNSKKKKL